MNKQSIKKVKQMKLDFKSIAKITRLVSVFLIMVVTSLTLLTYPAMATSTKVIDNNFESEVLKSDTPVIAVFESTWVGPARALAPIVERIGDDFKGKIKVVRIDIDDATEISKKYGIKSVPTTLAFNGGQKTGETVGFTSRENILKLVGY